MDAKSTLVRHTRAPQKKSTLVIQAQTRVRLKCLEQRAIFAKT